MCLIHSWDSFVVLQSPIQVFFFRRNGKMFNNIEVVTKICCNISYHEAAPKNLYSTNYVRIVCLVEYTHEVLHYVCLHIRPLQNYQKYYQLQGRLDRKGLDTDVGFSRECSGVFPPEIIPTKLELALQANLMAWFPQFFHN